MALANTASNPSGVELDALAPNDAAGVARSSSDSRARDGAAVPADAGRPQAKRESHDDVAQVAGVAARARDDGKEAAARDASVHAKDTFSRGALRWGYFLLLNGIAGAVAVAFFIAVFFAEGLDPYLMGTYEWLLGHPGVTSALAFSPLACSLLVGYGYASRARKRKKLAAQRAAAAAGALEAEPTQ